MDLACCLNAISPHSIWVRPDVIETGHLRQLLTSRMFGLLLYLEMRHLLHSEVRHSHWIWIALRIFEYVLPSLITHTDVGLIALAWSVQVLRMCVCNGIE